MKVEKYKRITVIVVLDETGDEPRYRVPLPIYIMIPETEVYDNTTLVAVDILVPERMLSKKDELDEEKIRKLFEKQEKWDREGVVENIQLFTVSKSTKKEK